MSGKLSQSLGALLLDGMPVITAILLHQMLYLSLTLSKQTNPNGGTLFKTSDQDSSTMALP